VAEGVPPAWPLPAMAANHQLFFWFFAVIVIAIAVPLAAWWLRRREAPSPRAAATALLTASLFGLGILPQALQRRTRPPGLGRGRVVVAARAVDLFLSFF
jgi:hypothetical protein